MSPIPFLIEPTDKQQPVSSALQQYQTLMTAGHFKPSISANYYAPKMGDILSKQSKPMPQTPPFSTPTGSPVAANKPLFVTFSPYSEVEGAGRLQEQSQPTPPQPFSPISRTLSSATAPPALMSTLHKSNITVSQASPRSNVSSTTLAPLISPDQDAAQTPSHEFPKAPTPPGHDLNLIDGTHEPSVGCPYSAPLYVIIGREDVEERIQSLLMIELNWNSNHIALLAARLTDLLINLGQCGELGPMGLTSVKEIFMVAGHNGQSGYLALAVKSPSPLRILLKGDLCDVEGKDPIVDEAAREKLGVAFHSAAMKEWQKAKFVARKSVGKPLR